ncbi:hypothetical protein Ddye_026515 [Dipteronia dyeriana]|uniref:Uncharacterized protein n=1 Tax=Dipteronia dyeriana TaxID=168575 RepID=A0AAD9TMD3_9ROSI|nr:hypothetical protein Ddye_026515 [Dipteronia dyeriana]
MNCLERLGLGLGLGLWLGEVDEPNPTKNHERFKRGGRVERGSLVVERWLLDDVSAREMDDGSEEDVRWDRRPHGRMPIYRQQRESWRYVVVYEVVRANRVSTTCIYLMVRITVGGDGSKLSMSKMEGKRVGRPLSGSFWLNGDLHRLSIIMGSWPSSSMKEEFSEEEATSDKGELRVAELVANGKKLKCEEVVHEVKMNVQEVRIAPDLHMLSLVDVVLGNAWLKSIGKVVTDFDAMTMEFKLYGNKRIWVVLPLKEIKQCEAQMIERLRSSECWRSIRWGN